MRKHVVLALVLLGASCVRLAGYPVVLCSSASAHGQVGIDFASREYGMSDFRSGFAYCSTSQHHCMKAPLLVSVPKDAHTVEADSSWRIDDIEFRYERLGSGFRAIAISPPGDLLLGRRSRPHSLRTEISSRSPTSFGRAA